MFVCLLDEWILDFCCSDLTWVAGGFELASTITLALQVNRLTKYANQPMFLAFFVRVFAGIFFL